MNGRINKDNDKDDDDDDDIEVLENLASATQCTQSVKGIEAKRMQVCKKKPSKPLPYRQTSSYYLWR